MMTTIYWTSHDPNEPEAQPPNRHHMGDAGMDLFTSKDVVLPPNERVDVPTNLSIALSHDMFAMIVPRSSTLPRLGIHVITGVIDSGYRGEMFVMAVNNGKEHVTISAGERIAQLLVLPLVRVNLVHTTNPLSPPIDNRRGGFGSTGHF